MTTARFIIGDSLTELRKLDAASVDLIVTSPPFLALRSYLPADHPHKALEMGSEGDPGAFLDALLDVVVECRRVLAPHGSLCVELGDTYSGSGGGGGDEPDAYGGGDNRVGKDRHADGFTGRRGRGSGGGTGWPQAKSLCLIPESFRFALVYGRNPHTGRTMEPWRARNVIRWVRPNPPVGALGDKFRPATSEIVVACMSAKRYFDGDAVRCGANERTFTDPGGRAPKMSPGDEPRPRTHPMNPAGAPLLDWWKISTRGYRGSHYATFPEALVAPLIKSMCPQKVCVECDEPSRRITSEPEYESLRGATSRAMTEGTRRGEGVNQWTADDGTNGSGWQRRVDTLGWTDCGHDQWRNGLVLDPFAGSGTTLAVATGHGHDALGIDLDERNLHLARERVGMFLDDAPPTVIDAGQI